MVANERGRNATERKALGPGPRQVQYLCSRDSNRDGDSHSFLASMKTSSTAAGFPCQIVLLLAFAAPAYTAITEDGNLSRK